MSVQRKPPARLAAHKHIYTYYIWVGRKTCAGPVSHTTSGFDLCYEHVSRVEGQPELPQEKAPAGPHGKLLLLGYRVESTPVLGGLDHGYKLVKKPA